MSGKTKILILRLSSIGDIILASPFIRQVHKAFPDAEIDFVTKSQFSDLLIANPHLHNLILLDTKKGSKELPRLRSAIAAHNYNYIFDLHNNFRSIFLRLGIGNGHISYIRKDKLKRAALVYLKKNLFGEAVPIPQRYLLTGLSAGVEDDGEGLEYFWYEEAEKDVRVVLDKKGLSENDYFVTLAPGAGFFTKRWPLEHFKQLIDRIKKTMPCKIMVLGGENDIERGKVLSESTNVVDLTGQLNLMQSAIVILKSKILITNDSGMMHLATAVGVPVLTFFGSSVRELGFAPYRSNHILLENSALKCRPCSHIGRNSCPRRHFKCMQDISPQTAFNSFTKLMNR